LQKSRTRRTRRRLTIIAPRITVWNADDDGNTSGKGPSFFDAENEEDDPILRQVEQNKINPAPKPLKPRVAPLPIIASHQQAGYESDKAMYRDMESQDVAHSLIAPTEKSWKKTVLNMCVFLLAVSQVSLSIAWPWVKTFFVVVFNMALTSGCERGRYLDTDDISVMDQQKQREVKVRNALINFWEFIASPTGVSVATMFFLLYSYWKFRRYGTDAGG
jgi:hypothetical protein